MNIFDKGNAITNKAKGHDEARAQATTTAFAAPLEPNHALADLDAL